MQHSGGLLLQGFECHLWLAGTNTPSAADSSPVPQHGLQPSASTSSSADQHSTCFACRSQSNERRGQPPLDPLLEHAGARQYIRCKLQLVDGSPSTEGTCLEGHYSQWKGWPRRRSSGWHAGCQSYSKTPITPLPIHLLSRT